MKYAIFLGCTVPVRNLSYELSARRAAACLGVEFVDIPEFSCCGYPTRSVHHETSLLLAARNLALAEERGLDICTLCSACTSVLTEASRKLATDEGLLEKVNRSLGAVGRRYLGKVRVKHLARVFYEDVGPDAIKNAVKRPLDAFRIASHYGCHYLKPSEIYDRFDHPEVPKSLDELVTATGAQAVDYATKKECCGGAILAVDEELALRMARAKLDDIKASGADAINLICPFCSVMYGANQRKIQTKYGAKYDLPIMYYPQVLGLALGIDAEELGLSQNPVKPRAILAKIS
ncbi:MAG: CoB--CoM heterodisulfide reductase iron-sulfur subunit B family protein [Firmicutes bacterium]|jgi:heterodisulfide reductase subunit B|nr:CoB--CoM heterodisulfide reductase iron-sulfur subunit B family protein [Bacillota bacterium]MDH7494627.1 CoB--CoM heterodisulfide reductase iron-sulfur subunit B family protein [Bacillota bacterium]